MTPKISLGTSPYFLVYEKEAILPQNIYLPSLQLSQSSRGHVDGGKIPLQQRETLLVLQVPIRLKNVWYGRLDAIIDPFPSKFVGLVCFKCHEY